MPEEEQLPYFKVIKPNPQKSNKSYIGNFFFDPEKAVEKNDNELYEIVKMPGDSNCMFYAVFHGLQAINPESVKGLDFETFKQEAINAIYKQIKDTTSSTCTSLIGETIQFKKPNGEITQMHITDANDLLKENMQKNLTNAYGDTFFLIAIAEKYKVSFKIFDDANQNNKETVTVGTNTDQNSIIYLNLSGQEEGAKHYDLVLPLFRKKPWSSLIDSAQVKLNKAIYLFKNKSDFGYSS